MNADTGRTPVPRYAAAEHDHYPHQVFTGAHSGARITVYSPPEPDDVEVTR